MRRKTPFKFILWLVPIALVWFALKDLEYDAIWNVLQSLSIKKFFALAALNGLILLMMAGRWGLILRALGYSLPLKSILSYRATAFGISYFTPGTQFGGEPYQIKMAHDRHGIPMDVGLSSVSLDKLFELVFNFSFLIGGLSLLLLRGANWEFQFSGLSYIILLLFLLPLIYLIFLRVGWYPLSKFVTRHYRRLSKIGILERSADLVISAEHSISKFIREKPGYIVLLGLYSCVLWLLIVSEYWLSLAFLGAKMDLGAVIIALTTARLAFLMPFPGAAGALEVSQVWIMDTLGFDPVLGVSLVLLIRLRDVALGLIGISLGSLSISGLVRSDPITQAVKVTGSPDYSDI